MLSFNDIEFAEASKARLLIEDFRKEYEDCDENYRLLHNNELVIKLINEINSLTNNLDTSFFALTEAIFLLTEIEKNIVNKIFEVNACFENDILRKAFDSIFILRQNFDEHGNLLEVDINELSRLECFSYKIKHSYLMNDMTSYISQIMYTKDPIFAAKITFALMNEIHIQLKNPNLNSTILRHLNEFIHYHIRDRIVYFTDAVIESISEVINSNPHTFENLPVSEWVRVFKGFSDGYIEVDILNSEDINHFKKVIFGKFVKSFLSKSITCQDLLEDLSKSMSDCFDNEICSPNYILLELVKEEEYNRISHFDIHNDNIYDSLRHNYIHETINTNLNIKCITYIFELSNYDFTLAISKIMNLGLKLTNFILLGEFLIQNQEKLGAEKFEGYLEKFLGALEVNWLLLIELKCNTLIQLLNSLYFVSIKSPDSINGNAVKLLTEILTSTLEDRSRNVRELNDDEVNHIMNEPAIGIHFREDFKKQVVEKLESLYSSNFESDKEKEELVEQIKDYINNDFKSYLIKNFGDKSSIPCDIPSRLTFSNLVFNKVGLDMVEEYVHVVLASFNNYIRLNLLKSKILSMWLATADLERIAENEIDLTFDKKLISERLRTQFCMIFFNAAFAYDSIGQDQNFAFSCPEGVLDRILDVLDGRHIDVEILHRAKLVSTKEQVLDELQRGIKVKLIRSISENKNDASLIACDKILSDSAKSDPHADITFDKMLSCSSLSTGIIADTYNQLNSMDSTCLNLSAAYMELVSQSEYLSFKEAYITGLVKSLKCLSLEQFYSKVCSTDKSYAEMNNHILELILKKKNMQLDLYRCNRSLMSLRRNNNLSKEISELQALSLIIKQDIDKLNSNISKILGILIFSGIRTLIKTHGIKNHVADALLNRSESNISLMVNELMSSEIFDNLIIKNIESNVEDFLQRGFKFDLSKIDAQILNYIINADKDKDVGLIKDAALLMKDMGIIQSIDNHTVNYVLDNINVIASGELFKALKNIREDLSKSLFKIKP